MIFSSTTFITLVFFSASSFAAEGFFTRNQIDPKHSYAPFGNAAVATFRLPDSRCTAFAISNDGYVITALHCIASCVQHTDWSLLTTYTTASPKTSRDYFKFLLTKERKPKQPFSCEGGRVVYLGSGAIYREPSIKRVTEESDQFLEYFSRTQGDYAILKYDRDYKLACIPISPVPARTGDAVWMLGYPSEITRPSGYGSDGDSKYFSYGKVIDYWAAMQPNSSPKRDIFFKPGEMLFSDVDGYEGNSGSPLLTPEGQLLGVAFAMFFLDDSARRWHEDSPLTFYRASAIYSDIANDLGVKRAKRIFSCGN